LDQIQTADYTGKLLLYPFSYFSLKNLNFFWPDSTISVILMTISFFVLLYAVFDKNKKPLRLTTKKIYLTIFLILIYLMIPLLTFNTFVEKNPYLNQFKNKNEEIYFSYSAIKSENPLIIKEMDYEYEIINKIDVKEGDWISAKAEFVGNKVFIKEYHKHKRYLKTSASILALILFIIILIKNPKRYK